MKNDLFGDGIPDDSRSALLDEWVQLLRAAKEADVVVAIRLTCGSLHAGLVSEVRRATVVLGVIEDGEDTTDHIALRAIAALTVRKKAVR